MAGKKKSKKKSRKEDVDEEEEKEQPSLADNDVGERLTLDALDAISSSDEEGEEGQNEEWQAEAQALRQAIADGAFNHLMKKSKKTDDEEEKVLEVALDDDSSSSQDENESDQEEEGESLTKASLNNKALVAVTDQLQLAKKGMAWAETFDVVSSEEKALPFDLKRGGNPLDVHDDLKRELAFYNTALDAVHVARAKCAEADIPFSRPDDFFAEMVKTDDHMARIKDRLIFENKKMDAFAQRKANQEHKLHAKEAQSYKLEQKAKRKRQHFDALDKWQANSSQFQDDDEGPSRNKKRQAADRKFGYGGKRGRFKQNSAKDLNDMSSFRPKGSGGGAKRHGKRARDAARSKR